MGEKFVRKQLCFQPAKFYSEEIHAHTYKCVACESIDGLAHLIQAQVPNPVISHSIGSASVIAEIIHQKYAQGVPLYRQIKDWQRLGVNLSETTLANWMIKSGKLMMPLYELIKESLMAQSCLQGDETPIQVLRGPGKEASSKSYMWVARTVRKSPFQAVIYAYGNTRSGTSTEVLLVLFNVMGIPAIIVQEAPSLELAASPTFGESSIMQQMLREKSK